MLKLKLRAFGHHLHWPLLQGIMPACIMTAAGLVVGLLLALISGGSFVILGSLMAFVGFAVVACGVLQYAWHDYQWYSAGWFARGELPGCLR